MSRRKSFGDLSDRQKFRRLADKLKDDIDELDFEIDKSVESQSESFNEITNDIQYLTCTPTNVIKSTKHVAINENNDSEYVPSMTDAVHIQDEYDILLSTSDNGDENISDDDSDYADNLSIFDDRDSDEANILYEEEDEDVLPEGFNLEESLRAWYINCGTIGRDNMSNLLQILRKAGHNDLPKDARTLVNTPLKTTTIPCPPGEYFHYGLKEALSEIVSRENIPENIEIDINIDGLPITKSTKRTLWPIQGKIVNSTYTTPFVIGVYHGTAKPDSITTFATPCMNEYNDLHSNGFICNDKHYTVSLRCVICDSPARSYCTCTKQFNGYFGCGKCCVEGDFLDRRMVFLNENAPLRTHASFRNRNQEEHHVGTSPFESLPIDMVNQFPIDYMHLVCLGVTKLLIKLWLTKVPKFSSTEVQKLSSAFTGLGKYVPVEFNRKPQPFSDLGHWKATVYRFILLYAAPIILNDSLPKDFVLHFNTFSCAIRILCDPKDCIKNNSYAAELLTYFGQQFKVLYGKQYVTSNVHNLIHLPQDVKLYGHLDNFSAFDFENFMQFIKKLLRKNEKPLQQIHRRLAEKIIPSNKRNRRLAHWPVLSARIHAVLPLQCTDSHRKLIFENFQLWNKRPNNCCILDDGSIIVIDYIGKKDGEIIVIGQKFLEKGGIKNYPTDSMSISMYKVDKLSNVEIFNAKRIVKKACLITYDKMTYVISLLHY